MLLFCVGDRATEAHAEFPVDAEIAAESVVPANENLLSIGFPKINIVTFRCSSEPNFRCGCWILDLVAIDGCIRSRRRPRHSAEIRMFRGSD